MADMVSFLDVMEMDNTQQRVASRRALALAHNRVEQNLGRFLRGARTEDEFFERLGLVQDDFAGYVTTASAEVSHDHPEAIAAALKDHYRMAVKGIEFTKTPEEEQEEEEKKEAHVRTWKHVALVPPVAPMQDLMQPQAPGMQAQAPGMAPGAPQGPPGVAAPGGGMPPPAPGTDPNQPPVDPMLMNRRGHKQGSPLAREAGVGPGTGSDPWGGADMKGFNAMNPGLQNHTQCPDCGGHMDGTGRCTNCGYDELHDPQAGGLSVPGDYPPENGENFGGGWPSGHMAANPAEQRDTSPDTVTCPECGGDGKTAGATKCPKCAGKGKVPNFGDPIAQAYTSRRWNVTADDRANDGESKCPKCGATMFDGNCSNGQCSNSSLDYRDNDRKTSADDRQNNTGLDGPEPKMDKSQGPGSKPDVPGDIVEKDPVEPIKATNESELKEIGDIEHEKLPSNSDDAGFDSGGPGPAPHTDTFGNDGQADPVTNTALSSHNPLSELLTSAFPPDAVVNEALLSLDE